MSFPLAAPPKASLESIRSTDPSTMPIHRLDSRDSIRRKPVPPSAPNISLQDLRESDGELSHPEPSEIGLAITDSATIPARANYSYALPFGAALASARNPSSASTASSAAPLRPRTARNPLDKPLVTIMPDQLHRPAKWDDVSPVPRTVITRRPRETESLRQSAWRWIVYSWAKEIVCVCVAVCCVIILFGLLAAFDGKPVSSLSSTISPSAAIQFPLTLAILSLLIPLSSCISQWKWLWFQTAHVTPSHPAYLSDFERFDAASRSVFGSFAFMLRFKASSTPAWFGAMLVVLLLATAPVTQLAVNYKQAYAAVGGVATAEALLSWSVQNGSLSVLRSAAEDGVMNWESQSDGTQTPVVKCSTADCTFPTVLSLGLCSHVVDITSSVDTLDDGTVSLSSLSGCELGTGAPYELSVCKTLGSETVSNSSSTSAVIYSMPLLYASTGNDSTTRTYGALEAIFSLCINAFSVSVGSGVESHHLLYTKPLDSPDFSGIQINCSLSADANVSSCSVDPSNETAVFSMDNTEFTASYSVLEELALAINTAASGRWAQSETQSEDGIFVNSNTSDNNASASVTARSTTTESSDADSSLIESIAEAVFDLDTTNTSTSIQERVSMLASSLTKHLNQAMGDSASQSSNTTDISTVTGTPLMPQTTVSITWAATTLLILQTLGAIALLGLTAVATSRRKAEVLKSSAMAQLVALSEGTRKVVGGLDDVDTLNRKAKVLRVVREDDGLVLGTCTTMSRSRSRSSFTGGRSGMKSAEERV